MFIDPNLMEDDKSLFAMKPAQIRPSSQSNARRRNLVGKTGSGTPTRIQTTQGRRIRNSGSVAQMNRNASQGVFGQRINVIGGEPVWFKNNRDHVYSSAGSTEDLFSAGNTKTP